MTEHYPDIEIYLAPVSLDAVQRWLSNRLEQPVTLKASSKGQWRARVETPGGTVPVLLIEKAADRFMSLWLDSDATPWPRDVDCARDARESLGIEVRCSLGGWQPGDEPDRFFRVLASGEEEVFHWPDPGA